MTSRAPASNQQVAETLVESMWRDASAANVAELFRFAMLEAPPEMRQEICKATAQHIVAAKDFGSPLDLNAAIIAPQFQVGAKTLVLARGKSMGLVAIDALPEVKPKLQSGDQVALKVTEDRGPVIAERVGVYPPTAVRKVDRVLADDRVIVVDHGGERQVLTLASCLRGHPDLSPGAQVFCAPEVELALGLEEVVQDEQSLQILEDIPSLTLDDLGGLPDVRRQLQRMLALMQSSSEELRLFGLARSQLVLFEGPPGTGKTHAARIGASILKRHHSVAVVFVRGPEFLNPFVGASEASLRALFAKAARLAEKHQIVYIIWDEFESLFHARGKRFSSTIVDDTLVPQFIASMDGLQKSALENIWFVAISNKSHLLDSAITREGRLGQKVVFGPLQSEPAIHEVASIHLRDRLLTSDITPPIAAERLATYAFQGPQGKGLPVALLRLNDGRRELITTRSILTGAMVKGAIDRAAERAWWRLSNGGPRGISVRDLCRGLDQVASALPLSRDNLDEYLGWPLDECARVVEVQRVQPSYAYAQSPLQKGAADVPSR